MLEKKMNSYRFVSGEEPSDEMLEQIIANEGLMKSILLR